MGIANDTYFIVTPGSEFTSKAYATLNGTDLFFYITETAALRVVNMTTNGGVSSPGNTSFAIASNAAWVGVISQPGMVHLYHQDKVGQIYYTPYTQFGATVTPMPTPIGSSVTFSVCYAPNSLPPVFCLVTDDGIRHHLYTSGVPNFQTILGSSQTYDNALNHVFYVTRPAIAIHPLDTDRATMHVQQIKISDSSSKVGFFVVRLPGVA